MEQGLIQNTAFADPTIILVFRLPLQLLQFGICVQILQICFVFLSNRIISRRYLFSFCNFYSVSAIWYFVFRCYCILVLCDC
jgi:hypothetical protein